MGAPAGHPLLGRDLFYIIRGRTSTRLRLVTGSNAPPLGGAYVHPFGVHINYARNNGAPSVPHMHILRVCINGCPKGAPTMTYGHPFYFVVARPLAFGSLPAPMHTEGCAYGCQPGTHYNTCKSYPLGNNPLG